MKEELICVDCHLVSKFENKKRGSAFFEMLLWITLFFPAFFYALWRKSKPKKICKYCGGNFLIPSTEQNHKLLSKVGKRSVANVASIGLIQPKININSKKEFDEQIIEENLNLKQDIKNLPVDQSKNSFSKNTDFQEF